MRRGSITVYLSLVLCVIVSLVYMVIDSARYSCGRAVVSLAAEEGLFSLFGEYDRVLYEDYGLLVLDGGYGTASIKAGPMMEDVREVMDKVLSSSVLGTSPKKLFRMDIDRRAVTGFVLATDSGGEPLREQIHALMVTKIGVDAVAALSAKYSGEAETARGVPDETNEERMERLKEEYEAKSAQAVENEAEKEPEEKEPVQVPENFQNPIGNIYKLRRLGVLAWAVPDVNNISGGEIKTSSLPSKRTLGQGMGAIPSFDPDLTDRFLLSRYITDFFPCFTDEKTGPFQYQAEYAVAGKAKDVDNLKSTLDRLLLLRETMNYAYLYIDEEKQGEALAAAAIISAVLLIPEAVDLVKNILMLCWAFGETMLDLKTLLAGGKVPLLKDAEHWQLSLSDLAALSVDTTPQGNKDGYDYKEYLCILLMMGSPEQLMKKIMDLLECNRRLRAGSESFSLDTCICSMEIQLEGCIGSHEYTLTRSFGYDVKNG